MVFLPLALFCSFCFEALHHMSDSNCCVAFPIICSVGFVLWKNGKYQCENWLLKQTYMQMSQSQTGLAQVYWIFL